MNPLYEEIYDYEVVHNPALVSQLPLPPPPPPPLPTLPSHLSLPSEAPSEDFKLTHCQAYTTTTFSDASSQSGVSVSGDDGQYETMAPSVTMTSNTVDNGGDRKYETMSLSATTTFKRINTVGDETATSTVGDGKYETVSPSTTAGPVTSNVNTIGSGDDHDGQYETVANTVCNESDVQYEIMA